METETFADAKVSALAEKFAAYKTDAEKAGLEQAKKYGVSTFPTLLVLNADGRILGKVVGYETVEMFLPDTWRTGFGRTKRFPCWTPPS